jgi:hypothetical protein
LVVLPRRRDRGKGRPFCTHGAQGHDVHLPRTGEQRGAILHLDVERIRHANRAHDDAAVRRAERFYLSGRTTSQQGLYPKHMVEREPAEVRKVVARCRA